MFTLQIHAILELTTETYWRPELFGWTLKLLSGLANHSGASPTPRCTHIFYDKTPIVASFLWACFTWPQLTDICDLFHLPYTLNNSAVLTVMWVLCIFFVWLPVNAFLIYCLLNRPPCIAVSYLFERTAKEARPTLHTSKTVMMAYHKPAAVLQ